MRHTQTPRNNLKLVKDTLAITGSVPGQSHKMISVYGINLWLPFLNKANHHTLEGTTAVEESACTLEIIP